MRHRLHHDLNLEEQTRAQNRHNWRVRKYYGNQDLVPGVTAVPQPSSEDIVRRGRRCGVRSPIVVSLRIEGSKSCWEVERLEDVTHDLATAQPTAPTQAPEMVVSSKVAVAEPDLNWTNNETVDLDEIPDMPLEAEDAGKEFEMVGEDKAEDFEVIPPSAENGVVLRGRLNPRRYLGR
jgi:hypothetical protein